MSRISKLSYSIISLLGLVLLLVGISTFAQPATTSAPLNTGTSAQNTSNLGVKLEATGLFDFAVEGRSHVSGAPIFSAGNMVFDGDVDQGDSPITQSPNKTLTIRGDLFAGASVQNEDGFIRTESLLPISPGQTDSEPVCANQEGELVRCIEGCTHPLASNFNPQANEDDGTCDIAYGCTNPVAANYDPDAAMDDGSCEGDLMTRAVCYYLDPQTQQQQFSTLLGTSCPDCTDSEFVAPLDAYNNEVNVHTIGAGGHGSSYTHSVGEGIVLSGLTWDVSQAGLPAVITTGDLSSQFQNINFETDYSRRWSVYGRAGEAGGSGAYREIRGLSVNPGEGFSVIVPPYTNNFSVLQPAFSLNHVFRWQSPPQLPSSPSFVTPNYAPSWVGNILALDIRDQTPVSIVVPTTVIRQSTNEQLSAQTGQKAEPFEGYIDEPLMANTANINPPLDQSCAIQLGGVTNPSITHTFNVDNYHQLLTLVQIQRTQGPNGCSFKDFKFFPQINAWVEDSWDNAAHVSSQFGQPSPYGGPQLNPLLQSIIPYTPGLGGHGGRLSASTGPTPGSPGNPGAVCFEWLEEAEL